MELLMGGYVGVFILGLKLLLVGEVLVHIVQQKFKRRLHDGPPLALSTGVDQRVDRSEQLAMLSINDGISCLQILCQFIFHFGELLPFYSFILPSAEL